MLIHPTGPDTFAPGVALALAIGLLVGTERGWRLRDEPSGSRVAGVRTFSLLALIGALAGLEAAEPLRLLTSLLAAGAGVAVLIGYAREAGTRELSATSAVAAILTIGLGAVAAAGHLALASVGAGAAVLLLAGRELLHQALHKMSKADIKALARLALVFLIVLPLLPDARYGPYALNPRRLWSVVAITSAISFGGYGLVRMFGSRRGVLLTSVVGALVSSTAVTLESARQLRAGGPVRANHAAIAVASTIMLIRGTVLVGLLVPAILWLFVGLVLPAFLLSVIAAGILLYRSRNENMDLPASSIRPPDLQLALGFGALILLVTTIAGWAEQRVQGSGAAVVALSGLFDIDSAIAALATVRPGMLTSQIAAVAVAVPVVLNTTLKAGIAVTIGSVRRGWLPAMVLGLTAAAVLATIVASVA